jgi:hypothetical protein
MHDLDLHRWAVQWLRKHRPDRGVIMGDLLDLNAPGVTRHPEDPEHTVTVQDTIDYGGRILHDYVRASPGTDWVMMPGNHDQRLRRAQIDNLRALYGLRQAMWEDESQPLPEMLHLRNVLRLDELGIEYVQPDGDYSRARVKIADDMTARHGSKATKGAGNSVRQHMLDTMHSTAMGHCFDDQTEILTPSGWQRHDTLNVGDDVMTLNRESGLLEWNAINEVHRYDDYKELVAVKGRTFDLVVTEQHGLWTLPLGDSTTWREETASEAFGKRRVMLACGVKDDADIDLSDDRIRLLAWIIAEGEMAANCNQPYGRVRLAQSNHPDGRLGRLRDALEGAGCEWSETITYRAGTVGHGQYRNYDAHRLNILSLAKHREWIAKYLSPDKMPTDALAKMSPRQAHVFLATYVDADGSVNKTAVDSRQIASVRKDHIDWLQALAVTAGYRSTICRQDRSDQGKRDAYYLTISGKRNLHETTADSWSRVPYDGTVWCVNVNNGTLLVRRSGKPIITLNTHRQGLIHRTMHTPDGEFVQIAGVEVGTMARTKGGMGYADDPDWQQGFATVTRWPNGQRNVELASYENGCLMWRGEQYVA